MVWSGFRPSDDPTTHGYNIPQNMYAAGALTRLLALNDKVWQNSEIGRLATDIKSTISSGLAKYATTDVSGDGKVYVYEVDGMGNTLVDHGDPNVPSLLSMPLLGYEGYDSGVYQNTRKRIWSDANPYFFRGSQLTGIGSPHTPTNNIWPLAHMVKALTAQGDAGEKAQLLADLVKMQCGNGLMHESVNVNDVNSCTRPLFHWANAMFVVAMEQVLGWDCGQLAKEQHLTNPLPGW